MARIRTIKPDAFTSDSLSTVPRETRWTFAGLWTYADDAGRARDDTRLIKAALYPLDDDVTLADIDADLDRLHRIGGICRYVVDERRFLHMPKWHHQKINRPTPPKSPPCPVHEDGMSGHVVPHEDSLSIHGALTEPSTWEKEGKGKGREPSSAAADGPSFDDDFAEWWSLYPRKVGKQAAARRYATARKKVSAQDLLDGLRSQLPAMQASDPKFVPHPETWLSQGRWEDEVTTAADDSADEGWFQPFTLPACPPEIADDPAAYQTWVDEQRKAWSR